MLLALETIMSVAAISTNQVKSNIHMRKYGDGTVQGSYAVFPTVLPDPTISWDTRGSNARKHCLLLWRLCYLQLQLSQVDSRLGGHQLG